MKAMHLIQIQTDVGLLDVDVHVPPFCQQGIAFLLTPELTSDDVRAVADTMRDALLQAQWLVVQCCLPDLSPLAQAQTWMQIVYGAFEERLVAQSLPANGRVLYAGFAQAANTALRAACIRKPAGVILANPLVQDLVDVPDAGITHVVQAHSNGSALPDLMRWCEINAVAPTLIAHTDALYRGKLALLQRVIARLASSL